jgi:hypothetical protein
MMANRMSEQNEFARNHDRRPRLAVTDSTLE